MKIVLAHLLYKRYRFIERIIYIIADNTEESTISSESLSTSTAQINPCTTASTSFTKSSTLTTNGLETTGESSTSYVTTTTSSTTTMSMNSTMIPPTETTMLPITESTTISGTENTMQSTIETTMTPPSEFTSTPTRPTNIVTNTTPSITTITPAETTISSATPSNSSYTSSTITPSTSSTISTTILTTTTMGNDYNFSTYDIYCDDSTSTPLQKASIVGIRFTKRTHKLTIILSNARNYVLLSKVEKEKNNINCFSNRSANDTLNITIDTNSDTSYIFCIKHKNLPSFSLEDCYTIKTLPELENQMWLQNRDKTTVYLIVGFIVMGVFLLTSLSLYILLRKHPKLLRNENITIIDPARAMKNPACFFTPSRTEAPRTSFNEISHEEENLNSTYMSPILVRNPVRKKITYSESTNTRSTATSYVAVIEPTSNQLYNWRNETRHGGNESMEMYISSYSLRPPPLPTRRKIYR